MFSKRKWGVVCLALLTMVMLAGCKKKPPPAPPPAPKVEPAAPPAPPAAPVVNQFSAEPSSVERGQSATLKWSVSDATDVSIDQNIGSVQPNGTRSVFPSDSTTYTLTARGPGGSTTGRASVSVTAPPPPSAPPAAPVRGLNERMSSEVQDALFDYDSNAIREDARAALTQDGDALKKIFTDFPSATVVVEGHCDERGSAEYNLGLGDRRATAAKEFLVQLGVSADKLKTISYGKERPQCTESNESCWQRNRRAHFTTGQ